MVVLLAFVMGMNNATLTVFAQLKGANNQTEIKSYLSAFTILLTVLSLAISLAGFFLTEPLLALLNTPESITDDAKQYLQIMFIGTLFLTGYNFIGSLLRAFGDSRTPMYFVDRKSTRLNSSHVRISYAVFCLKKKKQLQSLGIS